jgi:hypothetical protein
MTIRDAKALQVTPLDTPTDLKPDAVRDISGALNIVLADIRTLHEDEKFPLAHVGSALPRLSSAPGGTGRANLRHYRRHR